MTTKIHFNITDLDLKINNCLSNGFEEYLHTWEKWTAFDEQDMNHIILTCTKGYYDGWVCDIYFNEVKKTAWLTYSNNNLTGGVTPPTKTSNNGTK